ncbi:MAG: dienelactone hydrolase family protein [Alphaproteobacteria bacterium]|nr:dienelactone hydrolase family protein [Alphaproteobacteria bacterium]
MALNLDDGRVEKSSAFIKESVEKALSETGRTWDDVILTGRSAGGFMAMLMAASGMVKPKAVIAFCSFDDNGFIAARVENTATPIVFAAAAKDDLLSRSRRDGYIGIRAAGVKVELVVLLNSDHDNLSLADIPAVLEAVSSVI